MGSWTHPHTTTHSGEARYDRAVATFTHPFLRRTWYRYKWTDNAIHTVQLKAPDNGSNTTVVAVEGLPPVSVSVPPQGAGVAGVVIGDPCTSHFTRLGQELSLPRTPDQIRRSFLLYPNLSVIFT